MVFSELKAREGNRILRFLGQKVAETSSERRGVQRWSELTLFKTAGGEFILQKTGRTTVAHDPECRFVNHRMPKWLDAREEGKVHRTACLECNPLVGDSMDPHTRLEPQRYTVYRSQTLEGITELLIEGRDPDRIPPLVARLLAQAYDFEAKSLSA